MTPRNLARLALGMINSIVDWYRPDRGVPGQQGPDQMIDAVTGVVLGVCGAEGPLSSALAVERGEHVGHD